jgi:glutathione synthase/RimK-type ligase-like ATP-grasp enzyme
LRAVESNINPNSIDSHSPDLLILWEWEFDDDFVFYLKAWARHRGLRAQARHASQFSSFLDDCQRSHWRPAMIVDRASDAHMDLVPALADLERRGSRLVNHAQRMIWCRDKATMHLELVAEGIPVPYGIIVSQQDRPETSFAYAASQLGVPFVIKPSEGGGGEGVILNAVSTIDIQHALQTSRTGKIVLQQKVMPLQIYGRRGWLRVFFIFGEVICCWWDNETHLYTLTRAGELEDAHRRRIDQIIRLIARTCGIDFFTTEFAIDQENRLQVIDFVNEMCDMRMRSRHGDGVPDQIVFRIIDRVTGLCRELVRRKSTPPARI